MCTLSLNNLDLNVYVKIKLIYLLEISFILDMYVYVYICGLLIKTFRYDQV